MSPLHRGTRRRIPTDPRQGPVPRPWLHECPRGSLDFAQSVIPDIFNRESRVFSFSFVRKDNDTGSPIRSGMTEEKQGESSGQDLDTEQRD